FPRARSDAATPAVCFSNAAAPFFSIHARNGGENLWHFSQVISESGGRTHRRLGTGQDRSDLLRRWLDPAVQRRSDYSHRVDPPTSARQYRETGRWDSGAARSRIDPGFDRRSNSLRYSTRLPADAAW